MTLRRAVVTHAIAWGVLAAIPSAGFMGLYLFSEFSHGPIDIFGALLRSVWAGILILLPWLVAIGMLGVTDVGLLLMLRRATFNIWLRAAMPAVAVLLVAMGIFSAYVYMTMYNLNGTGHYYAWVAVGAGVLALSVYISHVVQLRVVRTAHLAENTAQ